MFLQRTFEHYLSKRGTLLKDAGKFFETKTEQTLLRAKDTAE